MIYMIRAGGFGDVKIGFTSDPLKRLRGLQTGFPSKLRFIRLMDGNLPDERRVHSHFAEQRKAGEWFGFVPEMLTRDFGLAAVEIPRPKRGARHCAETSLGRYHQLLDDLAEVAGGREAVAAAMGLSSRYVQCFGMHKMHLSALVVMARMGGAPTTLRDVMRLRWECRHDRKSSRVNPYQDEPAKCSELNEVAA